MHIDPRPLASREAAVLQHLLSVEFDGVDALRAQASRAMVVGTCDCSCPTIDLQVPDDAPRLPSVRTSSGLAPVEGDVTPLADEPSAQIILFIDRQGGLTSMEYVWFDDPPADWPTIDRIELSVGSPRTAAADPAEPHPR